MKYFIKTFGCQMNVADSQRLAGALESRGMTPANSVERADQVVINTCMVRQSAENRIYGLVRNLESQNPKPKIVLTGCMVGMAARDKSGKILRSLRKKLPGVDEFLPIEEVGFDNAPLRTDKDHAWVPISNGCDNFCSYCVVPYTRGREVSRPFEEILSECRELKSQGCKKITLLGQNVNSYAAGFPHLLEEAANLGFEEVDFISSNPWDFSDELIEVIARNPAITRTIHLPVQSGDDEILEKMNRSYSAKDYLELIKKIREKVSGVKFTTDIIVGFCGETEEQFQNTVRLCEKVDFEKAYIAMYSPRPLAASARLFADEVSHAEKKRRWRILERLINKNG